MIVANLISASQIAEARFARPVKIPCPVLAMLDRVPEILPNHVVSEEVTALRAFHKSLSMKLV